MLISCKENTLTEILMIIFYQISGYHGPDKLKHKIDHCTKGSRKHLRRLILLPLNPNFLHRFLRFSLISTTFCELVFLHSYLLCIDPSAWNSFTSLWHLIHSANHLTWIFFQQPNSEPAWTSCCLKCTPLYLPNWIDIAKDDHKLHIIG